MADDKIMPYDAKHPKAEALVRAGLMVAPPESATKPPTPTRVPAQSA
jgi:hypothetical protein